VQLRKRGRKERKQREQQERKEERRRNNGSVVHNIFEDVCISKTSSVKLPLIVFCCQDSDPHVSFRRPFPGQQKRSSEKRHSPARAEAENHSNFPPVNTAVVTVRSGGSSISVAGFEQQSAHHSSSSAATSR